jgi:glycine betaine/proline transport system substrate-binding protein
MDYIQKRQWGNDTVNALLAWMSDNQATGEEGAEYFLKNNEDIWTRWVSEEAAQNVRQHLNMAS